jgi:Iron/manganese superoxide dismutases, alpha-hairpin domain
MKQQCSRRELLGVAATLTVVAGLLASKRSMAEEAPQTQSKGPFILPPLPYAQNSLAPYISAETLHYHHDKHHAAYVKKLNELVQGTKYADTSPEEVIKTSGEGPLFSNAHGGSLCPLRSRPSKQMSAAHPSPHLHFRRSHLFVVHQSINLCRGSLGKRLRKKQRFAFGGVHIGAG